MIDQLIRRLVHRIEQLQSKMNQLDRRTNNMMREGKVTEVDYENGTVKVETNGVVSKPIPWVQRAGAIREWDPPAVGERVMMFSPTGEPGNGIVLPGGFSEEFPKNHNEGGVRRVSIGGAQVDHSADGIVFTVNGTTFSFTAAGFVQTGGVQEHDGKNVGKDHKHISAPSGPPGEPI